jgi:hypothetical protein
MSFRSRSFFSAFSTEDREHPSAFFMASMLMRNLFHSRKLVLVPIRRNTPKVRPVRP